MTSFRQKVPSSRPRKLLGSLSNLLSPLASPQGGGWVRAAKNSVFFISLLSLLVFSVKSWLLQTLKTSFIKVDNEVWGPASSFRIFLLSCCCCSIAWSCLNLCTPWTAAHQASLSITSSQSLLKPMSIESVMPSNHLILCHPLPLMPSIFPSIRVFSSESALPIRWPKYWSLSFSPSNEYSGLVSFRNDWFDLLAVQGTLKSLLYHHSSKASILWHSAFFMVQLSHPYRTTG